MKKVIVIGGGPAGMMAAIAAAEAGAEAVLWERNSSLGKKLVITGKGRCNITNNCSPSELINNIPNNGAFLYGAFSRFNSADTIDFFTSLGVKLKTERGRRVFPVSDQAGDIVKAFEKHLNSLGVKVLFNKRAGKLSVRDGAVDGVYDEKNQLQKADSVIVATGGKSYPGTGSTGDGYIIAEQSGHTVTPLYPALVPLCASEDWLDELCGLSLKNVEVSAYLKEASGNEKLLGAEFGEMLFTHFGVSGPIILTLSYQVCRALASGSVILKINLKPALTYEQLDERLLRDFNKFSRKHLANALNELLPKSLIPVIIRKSGIACDKPVNQITKEERAGLLSLLTAFPVQISRPRPLKEAIVTAGGVSVKELSPKDMSSKLVKGLFFAGEIIDVDGYTGGYNLQAALSTGYLAGIGASK